MSKGAALRAGFERRRAITYKVTGQGAVTQFNFKRYGRRGHSINIIIGSTGAERVRREAEARGDLRTIMCAHGLLPAGFILRQERSCQCLARIEKAREASSTHRRVSIITTGLLRRRHSGSAEHGLALSAVVRPRGRMQSRGVPVGGGLRVVRLWV